MTKSMTIHRRIHFHARGRRRVLSQESPGNSVHQPDEGRVPRVSRLMALAIHIKNMVDTGEVVNYLPVQYFIRTDSLNSLFVNVDGTGTYGFRAAFIG